MPPRRSVRRTLLGVVYVGTAVVAMVFLFLPIVAIFAHTSPAHLVDQLSNPVVKDAFVVTVKTSVIAQLLIVVFGTPAAYVIATERFRGRSLAITLVELPLVLPPAVAGIGLLAAFGHFGPLLAHELQHAVEIAEHEEVRDEDGIRRLYREIGHASGEDAFETAAARDVEALVRLELRRKIGG